MEKKILEKIVGSVKKTKTESIGIYIHKNTINCFIIYDNKLISGSKDNRINIVNLEKEYLVEKELDIHTDSVNCLKIFKNTLISCSSDNSIKFTNLINYDVEKTLNIHDDSVNCLILYNKFMISGSSDKTIKIINLEQDYDLAKIIDINESVSSFSIYNNLWMIGLNNSVINIINLIDNYNSVKNLKIHNDNVSCISIYKKLLISGSYDRKIIFTNLSSNNYLVEKILEIHNSLINCLIIFKDFLISSSDDCTIKITNLLNNYEVFKTIKIHFKGVKCLIIYKNIVISGSEDKIIKFSNFQNYNSIIKTLEIHQQKINCFQIYKNKLISGSADCNIIFTDLIFDNKIVKILKIHEQSINQWIIYQDLLISCSSDNSIKFTNLINYSAVKTLIIHDDSVNCLICFKNYLISGSADNKIKIVNLEKDYQLVKVIEIHSDSINSFSIENNLLFSASDDKTITIINLTTQFFELKKIIKIHDNKVNIVLNYKKLLISGSADFTIKLTKIKNFEIVKVLEIHNDWIISMIIYKNLLISSSLDSTIKITNLINNYEVISRLDIHSSCASSLICYNNLLITGSMNRKIKILNFKKYNNNISLNDLLYKFYEKINYSKTLNINILLIYNLVNTNSDYLNKTLINQYLKINENIIRKTEDHKLLEQSLDYFGYDRLFYLFNRKENLIDLIIKEKKLKVFLPPVLNYLIKKNIKYEISYFKFIKIFRSINKEDNIFQLLLNYVFNYSSVDESIKQKKLINIDSYFIIKSNKNTLKEKIFNNKVITIKSDTKKEFEIFNFDFKIPNLVSKNKEFFNILDESNKNIKLSNIKYVVNYFFDKIFFFKFLNLFMFIMLILSLFFSLNFKRRVYYIFYWVSICYFIFYEFIQFTWNFRFYYRHFENYLDIVLICFNTIIFNSIYKGEFKKKNYIIILLYYLNGIKLLFFLKSVDMIRKQIRLFFKVLKNTLQFIIFILIILLYLASINFLYNHESLTNFHISIFNVYETMWGAFQDDFSNFKLINFIELWVNTYLFNIILLNLFISIIGDIFNDYNKNKELYDIEEKWSVLSEYSTIYLVIEYSKLLIYNFLNYFEKKKKIKSLNKASYFYVIKERFIKNKNILYKKMKKMDTSLTNGITNNNNSINNLKLELKEDMNNFKSEIKTEILNLKKILLNLNNE